MDSGFEYSLAILLGLAIGMTLVMVFILVSL